MTRLAPMLAALMCSVPAWARAEIPICPAEGVIWCRDDALTGHNACSNVGGWKTTCMSPEGEIGVVPDKTHSAGGAAIVEHNTFTPEITMHVQGGVVDMTGKCYSGDVEWPARVEGDRTSCYTADMPTVPPWYQRFGDWLRRVIVGIKEKIQL